MTELLIYKLFSSSLLSIIVLTPLYYLLGYSTLGIINSLWHARFNKSYRFKFEDIFVSAIATLSIIIIICKVVGVYPQILLIFKLSIAISIIFLILGFGYSLSSGIKYQLPLPSRKYVFVWLFLFSNYLIRAVIKARSLGMAEYTPSRFNTDLFLYMRRGIVFLGDGTQVQLENGQTMLEILYNSPKLLSSLIYASFTYVIDDIGIAATVVTSVVLTTIILKYLVLIKVESNSNYNIPILALIILIIFQPVWCWLQDQFYWSNLLCIYLLIYALEDLLTSTNIKKNYLVKFAIAIIALAGFYPSQLPFFMVAALLGITLYRSLHKKNRYQYLLAIVLITIVIGCLFITQYLDTGEVIKHFDISDAEHGQDFNYIPFWSFLDFIPKTGGTPQDFGAFLLITASMITGFFTTKYCIKAVPFNANWFKLLLGIYAVYSVSYLLLPGEYRQSKFFFTYIVPLIVFCSIKILIHSNLHKYRAFKIILSILAIYVAIKSFLKPYKPHVSSTIRSTIETVQSLHQPTLIYMDNSQITHGYYYFAYQIKNLDFQLISGCPQTSDLAAIDPNINTLAISSSCPAIGIPPKLQTKILETNISGQDHN